MMLEKSKAPAACDDRGPEEQTTTDAPIVHRNACLDKPFRTVQAEAALQGLRVERVLGNAGRLTYIVIRGARAIDCCDLDAVRLAVRRLGGAV